MTPSVLRGTATMVNSPHGRICHVDGDHVGELWRMKEFFSCHVFSLWSHSGMRSDLCLFIVRGNADDYVGRFIIIIFNTVKFTDIYWANYIFYCCIVLGCHK